MHQKPAYRGKCITPVVENKLMHEHNSWEVVRTRGDLSTLRCRKCQLQVKMRNVQRCEEFTTSGVCAKQQCQDLHIHPQKMSLEERVQQHGVSVLSRVPSRLHHKFIPGTDADLQCDDDCSTDSGSGAAPSPQSAPERKPFVIMCDDGDCDVFWA